MKMNRKINMGDRYVMKGQEIYRTIRKIYLRHMIWPLFPIVVSLVFIAIMPFDDIINPVRVNSTAEAIEAIEEGHKYLEVSATRLIYSGYNYMKDTDVYGEYYYDLIDGNVCLFFLLEPTEGDSEESSMLNVTKRVKVEDTNGIFDNMISMFANSINWTEEGVKEITKDYILSEVSYNYRVYFVVLIILLISLLYGLTVFVYNMIFAIMPSISPKLIYAKYYHKSHKPRGMDQFVELVGREMEEAKVCQGNMYITEHFFINMDKSDFAIIPIRKIMLAYEHSTLQSFMGMHLKVTYTLHLKCSKLFRFHAPKKTLDEVNSILDYFHENEPDILIGYTSENKQLAKELISKSTSWFRK